MILFSAPSETENYNNQVNVKAYREFDVEKGKKTTMKKKYILTLQKIKTSNCLSFIFLSLKCNVDDVRVSREKTYILYKWIKSKRFTFFFPMVNLWFLNQHATNPVENSFVTILLKPSTHNESPYRTNFSQSKSFFITVSTDITIQNVWHNYPMNRFIFNP